MVSENRKAFLEYIVLDRFETGIVLTGTGIKSAREGKVQLRDAYAELDKAKSGSRTLTSRHTRTAISGTTSPQRNVSS